MNAKIEIPSKWGTSEARFFSEAEGEIVIVKLRGGATLRGLIAGVDQYAIFVEREEDHGLQMVFKHAIDTIEIEM